MKTIDELVGKTFVLRCHCNSQPKGNFIEFGVCTTAYYNDRLNGIMCENCNVPVFLSLIDPAEIKRGSLEEESFFNAHAILQSDKAFVSKITEMKEQVKQDVDRLKDLTPFTKL